MVCLRLRLGMLQTHLVDMFLYGCLKNSKYLDKFHEHYKGMIPWSTREQIVANLLKAFVALQTVRIVIDATEYF